ncbi:MAG: hypothetical protein IT178_09685 [Acidobacteria bacterium]|nr:hypothetical protein [Acidobacteriota bacterium]
MKKTLLAALLGAAALLVSPSFALAQSAPVLTVDVSGNNVGASWTAVAGSTGYRVDVGTYSAGTNVISATINGLSAGGALGVGTYFIRVYPVAGSTLGPVSNEVQFNVGTPRPGAPIAPAATMDGSTLVFTWAPPTTGGAPTTYVLQAGTQFDWANLATLNVGNVATYSVPNVAGLLPAGTYFARVMAANGTGASDPSEEIVFTIGNLPGVPTPNAPTVSGNNVTLSWNPPAGGLPVTNYRIEGAYGDYRNLGTAATLDGSATSYSANLPNGSYYWRVRAFNGTTPGAVFGTASFAVGPTDPPPAGPRTPNPATGRRLPKPSYGESVARAMATAYPFDLANSCHETGGTNHWMFKVIRELRHIDTRWILNWKRGNTGDLSQDIANYNYGSLPDEGTIDVYLWDIIGGHCGGRPTWNWSDVTDATARGNTIGRGTLRPYIAAGYTP